MANEIKKLLINLNIFLIASLLLCNQSYAQKPVAKFLDDSVSLGEPVYYSVVYRHQAYKDVYFPDSTYNFAPFEYIDRVYFPTNTNNGTSIDSAIYRLRTFNIDSIQKLSINITAIQNGDSSIIVSQTDSIIFKSNILNKATQLSLISDTEFIPMKIKPNIIPVLIKLVLGIIGLWILWSIFGKSLRKQLIVFQLNRKHREFMKNFKRIAKANKQDNLEKALIYWKEYLGNLHNQSYNTMTTKEIIDNLPNESLGNALKEIDEMVYGGKSSIKINQSIASLEKYITNEFNILKMAKISKNY